MKKGKLFEFQISIIRFTFFLILFFALCFNSYSQVSQKLDSLHTIRNRALGNWKPNNKLFLKDYYNLLIELSFHYVTKGDFDSASFYANDVIHNAYVTGDSVIIGIGYVRLGTAYEEQGEFPLAISSYENALEIFLRAKNIEQEAGVYVSFGNAYLAQGLVDKAKFYYEKAIVIQESLGFTNTGTMAIYGSLGNIYFNKRDFEQALNYFKKAIPLAIQYNSEITLSSLYANIGSIYGMTSQFDSSMVYFQKSLAMKEKIGDPRAIGMTLYNLGFLYHEMNNKEAALKHFLRGYQLFTEINSVKWLRNTRMALADMYFSSTDYQSAWKYLKEAIDMNRKAMLINFPLFTDKERETYLSKTNDDFDMLYSIAIDGLNNDTSVINYAFKCNVLNKGFMINSAVSMRNSINVSGNPYLITKYEEWLQIKKEISKKLIEGKDVTEMEISADNIEKELLSNSGSWSTFYMGRNLNWKQIQQKLNPNESLIDFITFNFKRDTTKKAITAAFIITPKLEKPLFVNVFENKSLEEIIGKIPQTNQQNIDRIYGKSDDSEQRLYDIIWQPLEKYLTDCKKVYISASGLLHNISFAALKTNSNEYLIDKLDIEHITSPIKIGQIETNYLNDNFNLSLFGGIDYGTNSMNKEVWSYLPGTLEEVVAISKLVTKKKIHSELFSGLMSSEIQFKKQAGESTIIHVATHGFFYADQLKLNEVFEVDSIESKSELNFRGKSRMVEQYIDNENPMMRSGLLFANANKVLVDSISFENDGVLTALEVSNLNLTKTELVVLSACETGLGDIKGNEGVFGLQRAFRMAGVQNIIMSLWQVPDKETAEFMILFYKTLVKSKDIHFSFYATQKEMRKKYDPYYWGAFVLLE